MDKARDISEPREFFDLLQQAGRHLNAGEVGQAKSLLSEKGQPWDKRGLMLLTAGRIAEAEGRTVAANALFRGAADALQVEVAEFPNKTNRPLALAQAMIKCCDASGAQAALDLARERGADIKELLRTEQSLALMQMDWKTLRRSAQDFIALEQGESAQNFIGLARACRHLDDIAGAASAARRALQLDPTQREAHAILAWVAMREGDPEAAIENTRKETDLMPNNPRFRSQLIRLFVLSGRLREAEQELSAALARWPDDPVVRGIALDCGFRTVADLPPTAEVADADLRVHWLREQQLRAVARTAPRDGELRRPVMSDDKSSDVIVAAPPGAGTMVLVFTAMLDVVSIPLPLFDRYLAALGVAAVYLKDFKRLSYLRGVTSLGDSYAATVAALREICQQAGARRTCTLGTSAGGFAAIRYGVELGADRVLSFAGEIHGKTSELAPHKSGPSYLSRDLATRMMKQRLAKLMSPAELDLRQFLVPRRYSSKIELIYAKNLSRDQANANYLLGIEGVTTHAVAGCDSHELLRWIALNGDLRVTLADHLGLKAN